MNSATNLHFSSIETQRQEIIKEINRLASKSAVNLNSERDLEAFERKVQALTQRLKDLTVASQVQRHLDSEELKPQESSIAQAGGVKRVNKAKRLVTICFAGGTQIALVASYWARKRFEGKRSKGIYPGLYVLGIHDHASPLLASEVSQASVALGSFKEACHALANRGCHIDIKAVRRITKRFAERARLGQQTEKQIQKVNFGNVVGRRVVISTDGGRIRIRRNKRGPKTSKKRHRYSTCWREPKLLIIYVTDAEGRADKTFLPLIDGILQGPDALFELLYNYLRILNIGEADLVLFVADGARWIWDR
jgi:hypothetical protein